MKIFPFCMCVTEHHRCERTIPITLQPAILLVSPSQPPRHLESHFYVFALFSRWGDVSGGRDLSVTFIAVPLGQSFQEILHESIEADRLQRPTANFLYF